MNRFVARKPILDRSERVFAYQLQLGSSNAAIWQPFAEPCANGANSPDEYITAGDFDTLMDSTRAFVDCPYEYLAAGRVPELPKDKVILEILARERPDAAIEEGCRILKGAGFTIALRDFPIAGDTPLLEFADLIKLDVTGSADRAQWLLIRRYRPTGINFIAEHVETRAQFQSALQQGYSYFQGQFFLKAQPYANSDVTPTKLVYLLVLGAVTRPEIDMDEVARTIKHDLALSYKLLRFLNSARFAFHMQVKSIRHALLLLGENELRKWIGLISVAAMGEGGPPILIAMALIRAAFCESLAPLVGDAGQQSNYFFMGLLSSIAVLLRRPMRVILAELPIAPDIAGALSGEPSRMHDVLQTVLSYEQGNREECAQLARRLDLKEEKLTELFLKALNWSRDLPHVPVGVPEAVRA